MLPRSLATLVVLSLVPAVASAGPPLICFPFDTGGAASLPWRDGNGWDNARADYPLDRLVPDTLALLTPETPVLARMETMRRATVYATRDAKVAAALLTALHDRAIARNHATRPDRHAWFDYGYLVETYKQANWIFKGANPASKLDGYRHVAKAITMGSGREPEMEFAAAIIAADKRSREEHRSRAQAAAKDNVLLAKNLAAHFTHGGH